MRFWAMLLVAAGAGRGAETVCLNPGGNALAVYRARAIATNILKGASIEVRFQDDERACRGTGIVIRLSDRTPAAEHPGALAYAHAFEGTRVVVFYDRVLASVRPGAVAALLGHVLAHEITHIVEGVEEHAASGVMRQRWTLEDFAEMQRHPLRFTDQDLALIRSGLRYRASRMAGLQ